MSLIKINNLSFFYYSSVKPLFENVTFSLDTNWKTAIIGRNGVGKSTIFKLLLGEVDYEGTISKSVECEKFPFVIPINNKDKMQLNYSIYTALLHKSGNFQRNKPIRTK